MLGVAGAYAFLRWQAITVGNEGLTMSIVPDAVIVWRGMAEDGADIAPYHGLAGSVPDDVKAAVDEIRASIASGAFEVPLDTSAPTSD